jgi:hypothetical protein
MSAEAKNIKQVEQLFEELSQSRVLLEICAEKLSNMELRQSHSSGECNDAIRAAQQWASGESSSLPDQAIQTVASMVQTRGKATYYEAFVLKDIRRGEFEMYKFYERAILNSSYTLSKSQHSTGECLTKMPCTREVAGLECSLRQGGIWRGFGVPVVNGIRVTSLVASLWVHPRGLHRSSPKMCQVPL